MSLHESLTMQEMEENGEMQFIRDHVAAAAGETPAPAPEADTVEEEQVDESEGTPEGTEEEAEEVATPDPEPEGEGQPEGTEEDEVTYLDIDDDTQALLDDKYGGDLNAMIRAAREAQSLIGRQGSELGDLRREMQEFQENMRRDVLAAQPYPDFPDEFSDGPEAAAQLRLVAETAFTRGDVQTFQRALGAWEEADPLSAGMYRDLKEMQIAQSTAAQAPVVQDDEATLTAGLEAIRTKFPQLQDESFQAAVAAELDKTPSLKAVLWEGVPGVSPQERITILEEAAQRVASRTTSETVVQAKRRVAVRASEEARAARVAAQSVRGQSARDEAPEVEARTIPMGESGRSLDINRLNAMLDPDDRV